MASLSVLINAPSQWICRPGYVKDIYMGWSGSSGGYERRGYHHGNLREALLDAALHLIAEKGPAGFTIAEAARLAGVSSVCLTANQESFPTPNDHYESTFTRVL